jgi:glycine/D-amino acid oxidase-like deaminating enzyme
MSIQDKGALMSKKVIVVGAGIIGASLAYHLAKAGAMVTVVDALPIAGGVATPNTWGWINASYFNPEPYAKLRMRSMAKWRTISSIADLKVNWCGSLLWDVPPDDLHKFEKQHSAWGYKVQLLDHEGIKRVEPALIDPPELVAHSPDEGVIEPDAAVRGFMNAAISLGAQLLNSQQVRGLEMRSGHVIGVQTDLGLMEADEVVIAAGVGSLELLKSIGIALPLKPSAALVVYSKPISQLLNTMIIAPGMELRQDSSGRMIIATDLAQEKSPEEQALSEIQKISRFLHGAENLELERFAIGYRPMPEDGFPLVGRMSSIEGLYVAVTHSGITLAPAIGAFGADEILSDQRNQLLKPYQPDRLISS